MLPFLLFLMVLLIITSFPSNSNSKETSALSSPFLKIEAPFCPGCKPKSANCRANKMDVFPAPIFPDRRVDPLGKLISKLE